MTDDNELLEFKSLYQTGGAPPPAGQRRGNAKHKRKAHH